MGVIDFPPVVPCQRCHTPMRTATRAELDADAIDPRYRHVVAQAAQGRRDFDAPDDDPLGRALAAADGDVMERPSWLLRCDTCGLRMLFNRSEKA